MVGDERPVGTREPRHEIPERIGDGLEERVGYPLWERRSESIPEPSRIHCRGNQSNNSASFSGAAYVFVRSGTTWSQQA